MRAQMWAQSHPLPTPALAAVGTPTDDSPFLTHRPPTSFRSPHSAIKGKHKLSPSPSPRHHGFDLSPRLPLHEQTPNRHSGSDNSSSPSLGDSPTPGFMSSRKMRMPDPPDSPIRGVPGCMRSLAASRSLSSVAGPPKDQSSSGDDLFSPNMDRIQPSKSLFIDRGSSPTFGKHVTTVPAPPLFQAIRASQSGDLNPRSLRRSNLPRVTTSVRAQKLNSLSSQKKAVSLGDMQTDKLGNEGFESAYLLGRKPRSSMPNTTGRGTSHRRETSIARSIGQKSGLALPLHSPKPRRSELGSNSSLSSIASNGLTPPMAEEPVFETSKHNFDNVKPNPEIFDAAVGIKQRFKGRDSTSSNEGDRSICPPSVLRLGTIPGPSVKRARSLGHRPTGLGIDVPSDSLASKYDFVVDRVSSFAFHTDEKPIMPNTPVKRHAFGHSHPRSSGRIAMSVSQPSLGSGLDSGHVFAPKLALHPQSTRKTLPSMRKLSADVPHLTVTTTSSPDSLMDDSSSPTMNLGSSKRLGTGAGSMSLLRTNSSSTTEISEDEITPTKGGGSATVLAAASSLKTPTPSPGRPTNLSRSLNALSSVAVPRLSLPVADKQLTKAERRRAHRQSMPLGPIELPEEEQDIFDSRFIPHGQIGRGAFSTVLKAEARDGSGTFAVKITRGVFDGVKDRLRHLEEVDILRHLSKNLNDHVLKFVDAWEQNRQLYIQTEECAGSLAAFLEIFGQQNEHLHESYIWKIARDIGDGIRHMHDNGVVHFDLKPANILVSADRCLKIADFGFATRWPRISPAEIVAGSQLGGSIGEVRQEKLHREGDHTYMPPEMLKGKFVKPADIYSFGLILLETAMNIYLPSGGESWTALRNDNFGFLNLSMFSPQLADFIFTLLNSDPDQRPNIHQIMAHPVIQRSWNGGPALNPGPQGWLNSILTGSPMPLPSSTTTPPAGLDGEGDVIMGDA
ncbi:uncharacterized protein CcaverHIS019_0411170 [Cutaneotrichosporon cavernicola]|uniref:Protein kinase domain-containing protein n=1 Tax=Cutaneotrichosporon cavernicola TaxID=279322 RepID=A0AA48QWL4_9TREE|nr:uncharacterized protein CcaverHIS019_0411170 [Cutaneotrichosporon cavernicola]BEI92297.1 hypothetical protein CcaverHIS019_0411170 [Cutaneotrichosporon cavernicola]